MIKKDMKKINNFLRFIILDSFMLGFFTLAIIGTLNGYFESYPVVLIIGTISALGSLLIFILEFKKELSKYEKV